MISTRRNKIIVPFDDQEGGTYYLNIDLDRLSKGEMLNAIIGIGRTKCTVPECDGMIECEKKIPSKEEIWDKYYTGAPEQQMQCVGQYKIVKRA